LNLTTTTAAQVELVLPMEIGWRDSMPVKINSAVNATQAVVEESRHIVQMSLELRLYGVQFLIVL
jgi:hypothetical protein